MPFPKINNILHLQKKEETEKRAVPKTETLNWFYATLSLCSFYYKPMDIYVWEHRFSQSPDQPLGTTEILVAEERKDYRLL